MYNQLALRQISSLAGVSELFQVSSLWNPRSQKLSALAGSPHFFSVFYLGISHIQRMIHALILDFLVEGRDILLALSLSIVYSS